MSTKLPIDGVRMIKDSRLDRYSMAQLLDVLGIDIKEYMSRTEAQKNALLETAMKELDRKTGRAKDSVDIRAMYESAKTPMDISAATRAYNKLMDNNEEPFGPGTMSQLKKVAQERVASSNVHQSTGKEISTNMKMYTTARRPDLFRGGRDSDPRDGVTKCQACGVGLMGDDVLERGGKVICPECADAAVRRRAKDAVRKEAKQSPGEYLRERAAKEGDKNRAIARSKKSFNKYLTGNKVLMRDSQVDEDAAELARAYKTQGEQAARKLWTEKTKGLNYSQQVILQDKMARLIKQVKPALDRARLHRALDAVMDSAKDGAREEGSADRWEAKLLPALRDRVDAAKRYAESKRDVRPLRRFEELLVKAENAVTKLRTAENEQQFNTWADALRRIDRELR